MKTTAASPKEVYVWDPLVRIGHWIIVITFFTAYITEDDPLTVHVWAGYVLGTVVLLRIVWGFVGPTHARFTDFVYPPATVLGYLRNLLSLRAKRYLGHSPAGGAMTVALLIFLTATVFSGLVLYAIEENAGPLARVVANSPATIAVPLLAENAHASDDEQKRGEADEEDEQAEERWEELHEFFANFTLLLVLLHVAGVFFASYAHRENLAKAMITGQKAQRGRWRACRQADR